MGLLRCIAHGRYTTQAQPGHPQLSTLKDMVPGKFRLKYKTDTEQGVSGSPIWGISEKSFTVVGIHTRNDLSTGEGVRLSFDILQQVFEWTKVGYYSRVLRANDRPYFKEGLYLRFTDYADFGLVHLGKDVLNTSFDILPAVSITGGDLQFVFRSIQPAEWSEKRTRLWVHWEPDRNRATLSPTLHPHFLVTIKRNGTQDSLDSPFHLATVEKNMILCLESTNIRHHDHYYGTIESAGLYFEKNSKKENKVLFEKPDA